MKFGIRKPSLRKSVSARTTGRAKRTVKKSINSRIWEKKTGVIKNTKKALYNKSYHKATFSIFNLFK